MNLSRRQRQVLTQLLADDELLHDHPTRRYSLGHPRRGWVRVMAPTVDKLVAHELVSFDTKIGYTSYGTLTTEGRALARELAKVCEHERMVSGRCIYCGVMV